MDDDMKRCTKCVMPDTRPDTPFLAGVCSACLAYEERPQIDWEHRKEQLVRLLEAARHRNRLRGINYDCIVPSSGGKDSTHQVLTVLALGFRPLVVTASTCHLTEMGRANIENLKRFATTIEVSHNRRVRASLNWLGLELVGDISWPEHVAIFTTPFRAAIATGVSLILYGENPQNQYGGPQGTEHAMQMTKRWVSEFGGFLGLRPDDLIGKGGISLEDMADYRLPDEDEIRRTGIEAHFLGQYMPWDSHANAAEATNHGMLTMRPSPANWWVHENLDNAQTGLHDHLMYRKYGFGRGCAQAAVDVRAGRVSREEALTWVLEHDGQFPGRYMGVGYLEVLRRIGMEESRFWQVLDRFTNWDLFDTSKGKPVERERPRLRD